MKNKIYGVLLFTLILSLTFAISVIAKNSSYDALVLKPSKDSEAILDNVELFVTNEDGYRLRIEGHGDVSDGPQGYKISINKDKLTYKTVKATKVELEKHKPKKIEKEQSKGNDFTLEATTTTSNEISVKAHTEGPYYQAADSVHMLKWSSDGTYSYYDTRGISCVALHENWIRDDCMYTGYSRIDGGRTITSSTYADYYSWKYFDDDKRTDIEHSITIEGYYSGEYNYFVDINTSGEFSSDLVSGVYVY